ncbi:MAG: EAL domain-containing protein [Pseudomonadota bacterium]
MKLSGSEQSTDGPSGRAKGGWAPGRVALIAAAVGASVAFAAAAPLLFDWSPIGFVAAGAAAVGLAAAFVLAATGDKGAAASARERRGAAPGQAKAEPAPPASVASQAHATIEAALEARLSTGGPFLLAHLEAAGAPSALLKRAWTRAVGALGPEDALLALDDDRFAAILSLRAPFGAGGALRTRLEALGQRLSEPFEIDGRPHRLGLRVGLAFGPRHGGEAGLLLQRAALAARSIDRSVDAPLVAARIYHRSMDRRRIARAAFDAEVHRGFLEGLIDVAFEPETDFETGRTTLRRARLVWRGSRRLIEALAERAGCDAEDLRAALARSGLSAAATDFALAAAAAAQRLGAREERAAVSISPAELASPGFLERLTARAAETRLDLARLDLEIAGGEWWIDADGLGQERVAIVAALKRAGTRLTLDGFGLGRVRPADLAQAQIDRVRIPADWSRAVETCPERRSLADGVLRFAESLRIEAVAGGVETERQAAYFKRRRCVAASGPLYGAPAPLLADAETAQTPALPRPEASDIDAA